MNSKFAFNLPPSDMFASLLFFETRDQTDIESVIENSKNSPTFQKEIGGIYLLLLYIEVR